MNPHAAADTIQKHVSLFLSISTCFTFNFEFYVAIPVLSHPLKVSKSQKQILKFPFEAKNERKYFCISALASESGQTKKT